MADALFPSRIVGMLVASVSTLEMSDTAKIVNEAGTAPLEPPAETTTPRAPEEHPPGWLDTLARPVFAIPALVIFSALIFLVNLGGYPFYTKGEPREAVTVLAIATGGGVILPMRAGIELPTKPLLMHWIAALLAMFFGGVNEWSVRMPSALFGLAGVLACYYYVRRLFEPRAALISALMLATSIQYLQSATGARVDMTLTFFMEVAFFEFLLIGEGLTRGRTLLYVAIALAVLAKGPVGLVLPGAVALVWIAIQWRWNLIRELRIGRGAAIVAILAGWWYVAAAIIGGKAFIEKQLIAENFVRFVGAADFHEGHAHAFYYLEGALGGGFLPWTPILALVLWRSLRAPRKADSRLMYLVIWFVVVLGFYSFSHSKRGVYLLPLYPALATITALYLIDAIDMPASTARLVAFLSSLYGAALATAGAAALLALAMLRVWPAGLAAIFRPAGITESAFLDALRSVAFARLAVSIAIPLVALALGVYLIRSARAAHKMVLAVAGGMGLLALAANLVIGPAIANTLSLKAFTADAMKAVDDHPVGYAVDMDYDVAFYARRTIPIVLFKDADKLDYLLCWENIWAQQPPEVQARYQVITTSNPTELDGSGRMLLLKSTGAPAIPKSSDVNV
jgi:4-amino-4-deoxy-L-arabinose transferase-like glycosyltransferase